MIRVLVGDTHGPLGLYELDETDPAATVRIRALDGRATGNVVAEMLANILMHMKGLRESEADLLRALPRRLRGYQWAKNVSPPVQGHEKTPVASLNGGSGA